MSRFTPMSRRRNAEWAAIRSAVPATEPVDPSTQHYRALAQASTYHQRRAELKRRIQSGRVRVGDVLADVPEFALSMKVGDLLRAQRGWGEDRSRRICRRVELAENRLLRDMTVRQKVDLTVEVEST